MKYGLWWNACILLISLIWNIAGVEMPVDEVLHKAYPPMTKGNSLHYLGTDYFGVDVLDQLLKGFLYSFVSALGILIVSTFIALLLGVLSAYYGNKGVRLRRISLIVAVLMIIYNAFNLFELSTFGGFQWLMNLFLILLIVVDYQWGKSKLIFLAMDQYINALMEWVNSLPKFILLVSLALFFEPSWMAYILMIGMLTWVHKARMIRAAVLSCKEEFYIESAKALGIKDFWVIIRHILKNIYGVILVLMLYSMAELFLLDASLNFLGISAFGDTVTWGKVLAQYRYDMDAWWLFVFPALGLILFILPLFEISKKIEKNRFEKYS